jgi:transposase InsO family protein
VGPKRLVFEMDRRGHGTVTRSTVYRVLVRNGLIEPRSRRRRRQDYKRWERPVAMQMWQLDVTASAFLADGGEVKMVTGIDDHSRYCVIAKAVMHATARPVCQAFLDAMGVYGVPEEVLSDNGTVFTGRFIKPRPAEVLFERICRENAPSPTSPVTVQRRVSQRGQIMVATQRIQVGMIHARKIVTVTADDHAFHLDIDGQTVATVPRTSGREIHRYKACATQQPRRPR